MNSSPDQASTTLGQPPPYQEVADELPTPSELPSALLVQLQVWHHATEGRSPKNNDRFAALFRNIEDWEVVSLEIEGDTGPSAHDQYVPVEVRFRHRVWAYNDPGGHPAADVRELFYKVTPQFVYQFFIGIESTPHNLNIFPVGVPDAFLSNYTHAFIINRLSIRVNSFFVPGPAMTDDVQGWLAEDIVDTTANVLDTLALIVTLFLDYRRRTQHYQHQATQNNQNQANQSDQNQTNQSSQNESQGRDHNVPFSDVNVPQWLPGLNEVFQRFRQLYSSETAQPAFQTEDLQEALNQAANPLNQYQRLAKSMEDRLKKLENQQTISHQDIFELVHDSHNAALHFSSLKQSRRPLVKLLESGYDRVIESYDKCKTEWTKGCGLAGALSTAAAAFALSNPIGWVILSGVCGGAVGAVVGLGGHYMMDSERGKAFGKKEGVREFDRAVKEIDSCVNQARVAIALVFCAQVMHMRLDENSPEHLKKEILVSFGIDVDALSDPVVGPELIGDRLRRFRESNNNLRTRVAKVLSDANYQLETTEQDG